MVVALLHEIARLYIRDRQAQHCQDNHHAEPQVEGNRESHQARQCSHSIAIRFLKMASLLDAAVENDPAIPLGKSEYISGL